MNPYSPRYIGAASTAKPAQTGMMANAPKPGKTAPLEEPGMDMQRALHDDYDLRSQPLSSKPSRLIALNQGSYDHNLF